MKENKRKEPFEKGTLESIKSVFLCTLMPKFEFSTWSMA